MRDRIRWRIARSLDRLPGTCWAYLVTASLGWHPFRGHVRQRPACRNDAAKNGACYCGKVTTDA